MLDINPYAPPATIAELDPVSVLGVGCWRHGSLLVIHEDAPLPPICVKTGRPADGYRPARARWTHPLRWPREYLHLQVPLTNRCLYWSALGRPLALAVAAVVAAASIGGAIVFRNQADIPAQVLLAGLTTSAILLVSSTALAQPLHVLKRRQKYYWLAGARKPFLDQLPAWPLK